jgi:mannose-6-phosphate isomerase-like protein (cupin superfamily)
MVIKRSSMREEVRENMRGGKGSIFITHLVEPDQLKNARLMSTVEIPAGGSIGEHQHELETEYYIILEGEGVVREQDEEKSVGVGDIVVTGDGESHSIRNTGSRPLTMAAIIIND